MNQMLFRAAVAGFLLLPPLALWGRFRRGHRLPWWVLAVAVVAGGWLFVNAAAHFYGAHVCELARGPANPQEDVLARCTNDGARNSFARAFGWLYGPLYAFPYLVIFAVMSRLRSRRTTSGKASSSASEY